MTSAELSRRTMIAATGGVALVGLSPVADAMGKTDMTRDNEKVGRDMVWNDGWRFWRGEGDALEQPAADDAQWRTVHLPHDWSIEDVPGGQPPAQIGPFDRKAPGNTATGFSLGGEGWYRKHFRTTDWPSDAHVELLFEGSYMETEVWLNGRSLARSVSGYAPFSVDLTPALDRAGDNVVAVRVRNIGRNSRWYSGSGLYRGVRLDILPAGARFARWGVGGWTRSIAGGRALVEVVTKLDGPPSGKIITRLRDQRGRTIAEATSAAATETTVRLEVRTPQLWSPDTPHLYTLESELRQNGRSVDVLHQGFGIRIVSFDASRGMTINGRSTKLRGGCLHHDNGILGACALRDADERRIRLLKARGYNAIRSAHNPSSRSLREACDRLGMLLIEEAFDQWHEPKEPQDFARFFPDHWEDVIRPMVLDARNSPSVIMWSIGNEIPYRSTDEGVRWQWTLANAVKRIDPTRPVTAGLNGVLGGAMIAAEGTARPGRGGQTDTASTVFLDVPGYNYRLEEMQQEHPANPDRVVYASETFPREVFDYTALAKRAPWFLGEFVWTAMDYLGEAGIGAAGQIKQSKIPLYIVAWPWVNAWCGDIDLIGQQKAPSLARDVAWEISDLEMAVQRRVADGQMEAVGIWGWSDELPSWTWPGAEGRTVAVRLYTSGDRVELTLNGRPVSERAVSAADKMRVEFNIPYAPGVLEAVAWRAGKVVGRRKLETVGPASAIRLVPERLKMGMANNDLGYVRLEVVDAQGRVLPDDQRQVRLHVEGPVELAAFASANPQATGSFQKPETRTFRGRALAIVRAKGVPGIVRISAQADGLRVAATALQLS